MSRVGIIGGSFIACEVAASLAMLGVRVDARVPRGGADGAAVRAAGRARGCARCSSPTASRSLAGEQVARARGRGRGRRRGWCCASGRVGRLRGGRDRGRRGARRDAGALVRVRARRGAAACCARRRSRRRCRACSRRATSASTTASIHGRARADRALRGRGRRRGGARRATCSARASRYDEVPYFWSDLARLGDDRVGRPGGRRLGRRGGPRLVRVRRVQRLYSREGRLVAAMTCGRSEDLDEARERGSCAAPRSRRTRGRAARRPGRSRSRRAG